LTEKAPKPTRIKSELVTSNEKIENHQERKREEEEDDDESGGERKWRKRKKIRKMFGWK